VVQLRLPARNITLDVFAWRTDRGVEVPGSALAALGVAAPDTDDPVPLSSIVGLSYDERASDGAIVIACTTTCFERQRISLGETEAQEEISTTAAGGYLNYEAEAQWVEDDGASVSVIAETALFGRWGLLESTWIGRTGSDARITRLESAWTIDLPREGVRARIGDSVHISASGAPVRFGGLQIGRYFGLTPSLITYPTIPFSPSMKQMAERHAPVLP
jgi:outer membrane usher protein